MRKWELITDLFDSKKDETIDDYKHFDYEVCVSIKSSKGSIVIELEKYPQHYFRLVEEPEFTESDMIEAMQKAWNLKPGDDTLPIIETIRKRKAGR